MSRIVLIVSRTRMRDNRVCVGGIVEETGEFIRIHDYRGQNLTEEAPYQIGDRWIIEVQPPRHPRPAPHTEDKDTNPIQKIENIEVQGIINFINTHDMGNRLVTGNLNNTFQGRLNPEGKYINHTEVPQFSTQFWISDRDLLLYENEYGRSYRYGNTYLKFVGFQDCPTVIPAGTIIRLSLANWWTRPGTDEERCYLQLSGWYL